MSEGIKLSDMKGRVSDGAVQKADQLITVFLRGIQQRFLVQLITIQNVYVVLGLLLFVVSIGSFIYIKWKLGGNNGTAITS